MTEDLVNLKGVKNRKVLKGTRLTTLLDLLALHPGLANAYLIPKQRGVDANKRFLVIEFDVDQVKEEGWDGRVT